VSQCSRLSPKQDLKNSTWLPLKAKEGTAKNCAKFPWHRLHPSRCWTTFQANISIAHVKNIREACSRGLLRIHKPLEGSCLDASNVFEGRQSRTSCHEKTQILKGILAYQITWSASRERFKIAWHTSSWPRIADRVRQPRTPYAEPVAETSITWVELTEAFSSSVLVKRVSESDVNSVVSKHPVHQDQLVVVDRKQLLKATTRIKWETRLSLHV
jgi:hypothetical protein